MSQKVLHQLLPGVGPFDAVTDHAILLRSWLQEIGFQSVIYAGRIEEGTDEFIRPLADFQWQPENPFVIYHHSIGTPIVDRLKEWQARVIMIYHNVTPPEFLGNVHQILSHTTHLGKSQLNDLKFMTAHTFADSLFNQKELLQLGYQNTSLLNLPFNPANYQLPPNPQILSSKPPGPHLLFVGRIFPNKKQGDLIKLLACYQKINPQAHLTLVGRPALDSYFEWLKQLVIYLDLEGFVSFPGLVEQADLIAYYQTADLYVSMSEHEGLGKPLLESMYFNLPILAYGSTAVPDTLGNAGALFYEKRFTQLAELVDRMINDQSLRQRQQERQKIRLNDFLDVNVRSKFIETLQHIIEK